ncbi:hypothetical protein VTH06DRAFT_6229 [Thermothelomyces fergusii]
MLRPATLLRGFAVPSRLALRQTALWTTHLARTYSTPSTTTTTAAAGTTSSDTRPPPPPTPSTTKAKKRASVPKPKPAKPFFVGRTASNQLAVYHLAKRGGNKKLTTIKKVEGNRLLFRSALAQELGLPAKRVTINNLTGHISVPGHRKEEVTSWLRKQGF